MERKGMHVPVWLLRAFLALPLVQWTIVEKRLWQPYCLWNLRLISGLMKTKGRKLLKESLRGLHQWHSVAFIFKTADTWRELSVTEEVLRSGDVGGL
jgi:hypothetical protein